MKNFLIYVISLLIFATPTFAQDDDVQKVIQNQIEAFQQDDIDGAFEFAAPSIRSIFGSSERFGTMVRQGYPMVFRQKELTFKDMERSDLAAMQDVLIEDMSGDLHLLRYALVLLDGEWKIAGVELLRTALVAT